MTKSIILADRKVLDKIYLIRGQKIMLDRDLAELYGVETKVFNQAVKRNQNRFPEDFMFQLTEKEFQDLRSQSVTSSWGGPRYLPHAFTEQGVAMLSSVLNSETAIEVNIQIIRIFSRMREALLSSKDILLKIEKLEKGLLHQDERMKSNEHEIQLIFQALKKLLGTPQPERKKIGYKRAAEAV